MIVMSNNQWKCDNNLEAWKKQGLDCSAEARVKGLLRAYREILPDLAGLQEVSIRMADLMMDGLYEVKLPGGETARYDYVSGGDTPLFYRIDRFKLLESGFFRYDESIPGLEGSFNNSETKSYAFGVFEDRMTGKRVALMSTHLWWKSSDPASPEYQKDSNKARAYQIRLASARMDEVMAKYACPGILLGDLNASMTSLCLDAAREEGWQEVHDLALGEKDETKGHHPCGGAGFSRGEPGRFADAIDHILVKNAGEMKVNSFKRLRDSWFDPISDHYPRYVDITL